MQTTNPIWAEVQKLLQKTLSKPSFETWIRPAKFYCFENGLLTLVAPNSFSSDWLRKNYCETIEKAAKEICGHDVKVVFKSETNISSDLTNKDNLDEHKDGHKIKNIIFIGTDLPDLCHLDLLNTIKYLEQNDLILGPSNDGGYWLLGLSEKILSTHLHLPFIDISWSKENVLKKTIDNFAFTKCKYKFLDKKIDVDRIIDIENRR